MLSKPSWEKAPEWAKWLAMDESSEWFWFEFKPVKGHDAWFVKDKGRYCNAYHVNEGWGETLERRPK